MKKIFLILLLFFVVDVSGQTLEHKRGFVSLHYGRYGVLSKNFTKYYETRFGYYFGGSLGIPLTEKVSLFGKLSYFQKEGIPIYEPTGLREGSAILKEGLINAGIQIKFYRSKIIDFIFSSGLTFALIDEERFAPTGAFTYETEGNGDLGIFIGGAIEINLGKSPFALVNEINYIYSWNPVLEYEKSYQALNYSASLRFYFGGNDE